MKLIILFMVFIYSSQAVQGAMIKGPHFSIPTNETEGDLQICKNPGLQCADCNTIIICIDHGNDEWETDKIQECDETNGYYCLSGECTNSANPSCGVGSNIKFPCTAVGMFPDPFDCKTYHICCKTGQESTEQKCDNYHKYDPLSTYCKTMLPSAGCPSKTPVPLCKNPGDSGALLENESIYYVCTYVEDEDENMVLYPKMHLCPNGKIYNDNICIEKIEEENNKN